MMGMMPIILPTTMMMTMMMMPTLMLFMVMILPTKMTMQEKAKKGEITIGDAINLAILEEMLRDPMTTIHAEDLQVINLIFVLCVACCLRTTPGLSFARSFVFVCRFRVHPNEEKKRKAKQKREDPFVFLIIKACSFQTTSKKKIEKN